MPERTNFTLEGAQIFRRNFAGREIPPYNPAGKRNFLLRLDEGLARQLKSDGWNVKGPGFSTPAPEDDEETTYGPYLPVEVGFNYPPRIIQITSGGTVDITEPIVGTLDAIDIANIDLKVVGGHWLNNGQPAIKAWLNKMYVTVDEDDLDRKYAHLTRVAIGTGEG